MIEFMFWTIILSSVLFLVLRTLGAQFQYLRRAYYFGITLWAGWFPVIAAVTYIVLLAINLLQVRDFGPQLTNLHHYLGAAELIILFVTSPLLFTRANNVVATAIAIYCLERLVISDPVAPATNSILLLVGSATVIAILGDKMPWHLFSRPNITAHRLREILILFLSFSALAIIFATIITFRDFSFWLTKYFGFSYEPRFALLGLTGLFIAWLCIALGMSRHFALPAVCLPSIFAFAYITHWPAYILVIPFAAILSLSLAIADRRIVRR